MEHLEPSVELSELLRYLRRNWRSIVPQNVVFGPRLKSLGFVN